MQVQRNSCWKLMPQKTKQKMIFLLVVNLIAKNPLFQTSHSVRFDTVWITTKVSNT